MHPVNFGQHETLAVLYWTGATVTTDGDPGAAMGTKTIVSRVNPLYVEGDDLHTT
jgi:hypothetical protein